MRYILALVILIGGGMTKLSAEPLRGWYNDAKLAVMRDNLARFDWAGAERDRILAWSDRVVAWDEPKLRGLVPPPQVPRAYIVHVTGCPVHGEAAHVNGRYSWIISPDEPWKVRCPAGGEAYPSNDFATYLAGGMTDRALLGGDYPDDGWGWTKAGDPKKFWFVGYYAHWLAHNWLLPSLDNLSKAYLITGERRYAEACAVLLKQLAEYYPDYNYETQSRYGTEFYPNYYGRLMYHTWECWTVEVAATAFDAIQDTLTEAEKQRIDERLLRQMARDITDNSTRIQGNYGMHQVALLKVVLALGDRPGSPSRREMLDWVLNNEGANQYPGIGFDDALHNLVQRDGFPFESPSYNVAWIVDLVQIAEVLQQAGVDVFDDPRFRRFTAWPLAMLNAGKYTPSYGDSNHMFGGAIGVSPDVAGLVLPHYPSPAWARALTQLQQRPPHDLFRAPLDQSMAQWAEQHPEPVGVTSSILPAVGYASLQDGRLDGTAAALFYGKYVGHQHYDRLQLDLYAHGWPLTPDFGYPETADGFDPRRGGFFEHTVSHNTVMVDAGKQHLNTGRLHVFDPGAFAQVLDASAAGAYPQTELYRRTLIQIEVADGKSVLVDVFRVRGGSQHDWLVHGTESELVSDLPLSETQTDGTLAGPDVPYGHFYDDEKLAEAPKGTVVYHYYTGSGYQFLFNLRSAPLTPGGMVEWRLNRDPNIFPKLPTEGIALRAHLFGHDEQIICAEGKPQFRKGFPETVPFVIRRRTGENLESVFVTVFEPYRDTPILDSVESLPVTGDGLPVALKLTAGGRELLVVDRLRSGTPLALGDGIETDGRTMVIARGGDRPAQTYLLDGQRGQWGEVRIEGEPALESTVAGVDLAAGTILLADPMPAGAPTGGQLIVESDRHAVAVPVQGDGSATVSLVDDDLIVGQHKVTAVEGDTMTLYPAWYTFGQPGMSVMDEAGTPLGRLLEVNGETATLDRPAPDPASLPDADGDGRVRVRTIAVGAGDKVIWHRSRRG